MASPKSKPITVKIPKWVVEERDRVCLYGLSSKDCSGGLDPHHIIPVSQGGDDVVENIITLCRKHHDQAQGYIIKPEELRRLLGEFYGYGM